MCPHYPLSYKYISDSGQSSGCLLCMQPLTSVFSLNMLRLYRCKLVFTNDSYLWSFHFLSIRKHWLV